MTKKKTRSIICALLTGSLLCLGGMVAYTVKAADVPNSDVINISKEYDLETEFIIPEYMMTVDGEETAARGVVIFPDGSVKKGNKVVLDQVGWYTLQYTATVNGKIDVQEYTFCVQQTLVTSNYGSKAEYTDFVYNGEVKTSGIQVNLQKNDTVTFHQLIDVSNVTIDDLLVEGFVTPQTVGTADLDKLIFTFTDSENPDVYLTVTNRRYLNETTVGHSFYLAGGENQLLTGLEASTQRVHVANIYGSWSYHGYTGEYVVGGVKQARSPSEYPFQLFYDSSSLEVYSEGGFIIDLDSTKYFERLWNGFPSGKVKLSISASGFNAPTADFFITQIKGVDLTQKKCEDTLAPQITVDSTCLDENAAMPISQLGAWYTIPQATAMDAVDGKTDVQVKAWYNYADENAVNVKVTDGQIKTDKLGVYSLVYTATDRMGNTATKILSFNTVTKTDEMQLTLADGCQTTAYLGEIVSVPALDGIHGGSGNKSVCITAEKDGERIEVEDGKIYFEKEGVWSIVYTATDYLGNMQSEAYEITVVRPESPVLLDEIVLPDLYMAGFTYTLPTAFVNDYTSGGLVRRLCAVKVTNGTDTSSYTAGDTFVPTAAEHKDSVTISYQYGGVEYFTKKIPVAKVIDGDSVLLENYFYGDGFTAEKTRNGVELASTADVSAFSWQFANSLLAERFNIILDSVADKSEFSVLQFTLTDEQSLDVSISFTIARRNGVTYFETGAYSYELDYDFLRSVASGDANLLEISYGRGAFQFGTTKIDVEKTDRGAIFEGFPSGKVILTCKTDGIVGVVAYRIYSLNGHRFAVSTRDRVAPQMAVEGTYGGSYALNDTYVIPRVLVGDVLCPTTKVTMTVTMNGKSVEDVDGVLLEDVIPNKEYSILLSEYGAYEIYYKYAEVGSLRENEDKFIYVVNVEDRRAPTIEFSCAFQTAIKKGEYLILPDFTVTDDRSVTENLTILKQVVNPNGGITVLNGNALKCDYMGVYTVRIFVADEAGNAYMYTTMINVTEGGNQNA